MRFAGYKVSACPSCRARFQEPIVGSVFLRGTTRWSDGYEAVSHFLAQPAVIKCRQCGECYWRDEAEEVDAVELEEIPRYDSPCRPSTEDYYVAISKGLATTAEEEKRLRILTWWRSNDVLRPGSKEKYSGLSESEYAEKSAARLSNMERLYSLLDEGNEQERLMKGEILRECGRFEEASVMLNSITTSPFRAIAQNIRKLCKSRNPYITVL